MATTVPKAFDEFEAKLQPTADQKSMINARRSKAADYVRESFGPSSNMPLVSTKVIGSAGTDTIIRPKDDIDVPERAVVGVGDNCQMSEGEPLQWVWSDAWVLAAIMMTQQEGGCSLTDVVAAADAVNHPILMENEVESAVRKLLGAELIATRQRAFFLTEAGEVMKATKHGGLLGPADQLLLALRRLPVDAREWKLQPGELRHDADAWNARAQQLIEIRRKPRPHY